MYLHGWRPGYQSILLLLLFLHDVVHVGTEIKKLTVMSWFICQSQNSCLQQLHKRVDVLSRIFESALLGESSEPTRTYGMSCLRVFFFFFFSLLSNVDCVLYIEGDKDKWKLKAYTQQEQ